LLLIPIIRKKIKKKKAGIDVFTKEPTAKDNPLFKLDNIIVTPHSATGTG